MELNVLITLENMQLPCQNLVALRDPKKSGQLGTRLSMFSLVNTVH